VLLVWMRLVLTLTESPAVHTMGFFFCARVNQQFYTILRWFRKTEFSEAFPRGRRRNESAR
jgi:hypothetical protein